jgi:hypothetical protein
MYQCGGMLVMGKKGKENAAVFSNMADGKKRWEFGGTDFIFDAFEIDNSSILLATAFNLYKIDAATGKEIWKSAISQDVEMMEDMGALGGLLKKVAAKHAENNSSVTAVELYVRPEINSFFLAVEVLKEEHVTSSDGKTTVNKSPQSTCNGFSINDGRLLWSKGAHWCSYGEFLRDSFNHTRENGAAQGLRQVSDPDFCSVLVLFILINIDEVIRKQRQCPGR